MFSLPSFNCFPEMSFPESSWGSSRISVFVKFPSFPMPVELGGVLLLLPQALALACLSLAFAPAAASQGGQGWPQGQAHLLPPCVGLAAPAVPAVPAVPAAALAARVHAQARRSRWLLALLKVMLKLSLQDRLLERQSCRPPHALQDWGWQAKPLWGCSHTSAGAGLGG